MLQKSKYFSSKILLRVFLVWFVHNAANHNHQAENATRNDSNETGPFVSVWYQRAQKEETDQWTGETTNDSGRCL